MGNIESTRQESIRVWATAQKQWHNKQQMVSEYFQDGKITANMAAASGLGGGGGIYINDYVDDYVDDEYI
jgi:hypothetical protein